jgi:nucleoid DNA-binding protein
MPVKSKKSVKSIPKTQLVSELAEKSSLSKSQVLSVLDALTEKVNSELRSGRPISLPGLVKITLQHKGATPARPGRNPATGETIQISAKPARKVVRVRVLKALKDVAK